MHTTKIIQPFKIMNALLKHFWMGGSWMWQKKRISFNLKGNHLDGRGEKNRVTSLLSQNLICLKKWSCGGHNQFPIRIFRNVRHRWVYVLMSYGVCISAPQFPAHHAQEKQKSQLLRVVVAGFFSRHSPTRWAQRSSKLPQLEQNKNGPLASFLPTLKDSVSKCLVIWWALSKHCVNVSLVEEAEQKI